MSDVWRGTIVNPLCSRCLVTRSQLCNMKVVGFRDMSGTLTAREEYEMFINKIGTIMAAIYG